MLLINIDVNKGGGGESYQYCVNNAPTRPGANPFFTHRHSAQAVDVTLKNLREHRAMSDEPQTLREALRLAQVRAATLACWGFT